jgi:polysaccharide biosynthesis protein PslG
MPSLRLALLGAVAALAMLAPATASAAGCRSDAHAHFVGLGGGDSLMSGNPGCILATQARAGAGVLRQGIDWNMIEQRKGHYSFHSYDRWVLAAAKHHFRILAILSNPPSFRAKNPAGRIAPPNSYKAYGRYAAAVVRRYGRNGSLWRGKHRKLRRWAIHSWQIWNEPNIPQYWGNHPNAKQYTRLLKVAARSIHRVDKHAEIVTAGLPESLIKGAIQATKYIPKLYKAGAKKWFTTLAINPYGPTAANVVKNVRQARRIMNRHHDRGGHLWIAEVGWGTGGPKHRFNIGVKGQARQLGKLLHRLYRARHKLKLRGLVYFGWKDRKPYPPNYDDQWGLHTGLLTAAGKEKPSYKVFARVAPHLH